MSPNARFTNRRKPPNSYANAGVNQRCIAIQIIAMTTSSSAVPQSIPVAVTIAVGKLISDLLTMSSLTVACPGMFRQSFSG
jgi:hypothetical protein